MRLRTMSMGGRFLLPSYVARREKKVSVPENRGAFLTFSTANWQKVERSSRRMGLTRDGQVSQLVSMCLCRKLYLGIREAPLCTYGPAENIIELPERAIRFSELPVQVLRQSRHGAVELRIIGRAFEPEIERRDPAKIDQTPLGQKIHHSESTWVVEHHDCGNHSCAQAEESVEPSSYQNDTRGRQGFAFGRGV